MAGNEALGTRRSGQLVEKTRAVRHGAIHQYPQPGRCRKNRTSASLHFSPRGEAKGVRGPSGRGASRLAPAGVATILPPLVLGSRNKRHETRPVCFTGRQIFLPGANQAPANGFHESRDTRHESRPFYRVLRPSGGEKCRLAVAQRRRQRGRRGQLGAIRLAGSFFGPLFQLAESGADFPGPLTIGFELEKALIGVQGLLVLA